MSLEIGHLAVLSALPASWTQFRSGQTLVVKTIIDQSICRLSLAPVC